MPRKQKHEDTGLAGLSIGAAQETPTRITPVDIQQKEFRLAFRGYNERDVDAFLDEVTEEVARLHAENKRLREQLDFPGTAPISTAAATEADDLVKRARQEADRILDEARTRAAATPGPAEEEGGQGGARSSSTRHINAFLARERTFLQDLAERIQSHAHAVKEDVQTIRVASTPPAVAATAPEEAASPEGRTPATEVPQQVPPEESSSGHEGQGDIEGRSLDAGGPEAGESAAEPAEGSARPIEEPAAASDTTEATDVATEVWTPAFLRPGSPAGPAETSAEGKGGPTAGETEFSEGEPVVDLTGSERNEEEGTQPAEVLSGIPTSPKPEEDEGEDRSLRDLFWGEN